jgi:hypothetical protein
VEVDLMLAPLLALSLLAAAPRAPLDPAGDCADVVVDAEPVDPVPWVIGGGFATATAGFLLFTGAHLGAVATSALAGAPASIVGTVAIPVVGPVLAIAQTGGVPVAFLPVALGIFGAQATGIALLAGGAVVGAGGVAWGVLDAE